MWVIFTLAHKFCISFILLFLVLNLMCLVCKNYSFPARNSIIIPKILPTWSECEGFYLCWWVLISPWVCNESAFSGSPFGSLRVIDGEFVFSACDVCSVFLVMHDNFTALLCGNLHCRGYLRWWMVWILRTLWLSCLHLVVKLLHSKKLSVSMVA